MEEKVLKSIIDDLSLVIDVTDDDIKIHDSHKVSKHDFGKVLNELREKYPENPVLLNRKNFLMEMEWTTHNALYGLNIKVESTKDVDLNYPLPWYEKIGYLFVGLATWLFIK